MRSRFVNLCRLNIVNIIGGEGGSHDHLMSVRIFTLRMNKILIQTLQMAIATMFIANCLALIACFIFLEQNGWREKSI